MNAVAIPQAVKRVIGRCILAALVAVLVLPLAVIAGWGVALLVWGFALAVLGLYVLGMKWGFDE